MDYQVAGLRSLIDFLESQLSYNNRAINEVHVEVSELRSEVVGRAGELERRVRELERRVRELTL